MRKPLRTRRALPAKTLTHLGMWINAYHYLRTNGAWHAPCITSMQNVNHLPAGRIAEAT